MIIQAFYDNGINSAKDQAAFAIAKKYGAALRGSGCWLCEPFTRDLKWDVLDSHAPAMKKELRNAGFRLHH